MKQSHFRVADDSEYCPDRFIDSWITQVADDSEYCPDRFLLTRKTHEKLDCLKTMFYNI